MIHLNSLKDYLIEKSNTEHDNAIADEIRSLIKAGYGSKRAKKLLDTLDINPKDVIKVIHKSGKNERRSLSPKPKNVGHIVADIILVVRTPNGNKTYPISIKDPAGSTFGNFGIAGSFDLDENKQVIISPHPSDQFLKAMGISKKKMQRGLQKYIDKGIEPVKGTVNTDIDKNPQFDIKILRKFLMAGYGYGYWYAREWTNNEWEIRDLRTFKKLKEYVGIPKVEFVSYPGETKQTHAMIHTSNDHKYNVDIRNSKGGDIPKEIKIRITTS